MIKLIAAEIFSVYAAISLLQFKSIIKEIGCQLKKFTRRFRHQ